MSRRGRVRVCSLCGERRLTTREHVVARGLYPATSRFQRIIIEACADCNNGSADDDAHFRNVLLMAGDPNSAVVEIWGGTMARALEQPDGGRRARELMALMQPATDVAPDRYRIYPGRDPRVLRSVRKLVRGLCHHHDLLSAVPDDRVSADVLTAIVPSELLDAAPLLDADPDVLEYRYFEQHGAEGMHSVWLLRFYRRTEFYAVVFEEAPGDMPS